jgi:hypothetical protein
MVFLGQQKIRLRENVQRARHVKSLHSIKYNQSQLHWIFLFPKLRPILSGSF